LRVLPAFLKRPPEGKEAYVERIVKLFRVIGSPAFERDESELREMAAQSFDRGADAAGTARQMAAIIASGHRADELRRVQAPTLVIHGTKDRLIRKSGGKATAKAIPGARLKLIEGMGHDLPRGTWPEIMDGIASNAKRAGEPVEQAA
jgi:pimeloyl-ACP methyl ester carboxylesterase